MSLKATISIFLSFGFSVGIIYWARQKFGGLGFQDYATSRSLHFEVTPKVGGLALLPSLCLGLLTYSLFKIIGEGQQSFRFDQFVPLLIWITPAFIVYVVCFLSDRAETELSAMTRLLSFIAASFVFVGLTVYLSNMRILELLSVNQSTIDSVPHLTKILGLVSFVVLSVLAFTNFYNFMDGIDGLAGSMGLIGFSALGLAALPGQQTSHLSIASSIVSASCLGFLFWNWPKAKVFMGDTGSTFLGFSAAALGWLGSIEGLWHWSFPFLVFFPFWFDASITLLRRLLRGEKIWQAHREHFYQRAVLSLEGMEMSERHLKVLIPSIALMLTSSCVALAQQLNWLGLSRFQPWAALAILALIHGSLALRVDARYRALDRKGPVQEQKT